MNYTENEMKQILEQEVEIPKKVDERLQDTYSRIRSQNKTRTNYAKKSWRMITAAAAAVVLTLTVTGGTAAAAYLSEHISSRACSETPQNLPRNTPRSLRTRIKRTA